MYLRPSAFWSLLPREFWIKYRAFIRAENRAESARIRQAMRTAPIKKADLHKLEQAANRLRQYPVKPWLKSR